MFTVPEPHTPVSTTTRHLWETAVYLATTRARQALPDSIAQDTARSHQS
jgi:hypothetical protein